MSNLNVEFYFDPEGVLNARECERVVDVPPVLRDGTLGVIDAARAELREAVASWNSEDIDDYVSEAPGLADGIVYD